MREVVPLEWWHARRWGVIRLSDDVYGYSVLNHGEVEAICGCVRVEGPPEKVYVFAHGKIGVSAHKAALRLLEDLDSVAMTPLYATAEARIAQSVPWLVRLGFKPTGDGEYVRELHA